MIGEIRMIDPEIVDPSRVEVKKKKLLMMKGLPGAGKSTAAALMIMKGRVSVVNKDSIRKELEAMGWEWSRENEKDVIETRDKRIIAALRSPMYDLVVSDDTNFGPKHERRLREIALEMGAEFEIMILDTPIDVCIERDSKRPADKKVGETVIRKMAEQQGLIPKGEGKKVEKIETNHHIFCPSLIGGKCLCAVENGENARISELEPQIEPYVVPEHRYPALICDLDGTLALNQGGARSFYDASECHRDKVCYPVHDIVSTMSSRLRWIILYVTGREEKYRIQSQEWLKAHNCPPGPLFMRTTGDFRKDWIVKLEIFNSAIRKNYNVKFVLDDRDQVVKMWRKLGIQTLQVAPGDF